MNKIPETHLNLLADETKALAFLATIMPDGTPQVTPVWFSTDGEYILINTALGRTKDKNITARPHVAITIMDLSEPYRYLQLRGKVVESTSEGAVAHIHALSHKYRGKDWDLPEGQGRKIFKVRVEKVSVMG